MSRPEKALNANDLPTRIMGVVDCMEGLVLVHRDADSLRMEIKATSAVLARIHHQKTWYRPKADIYVSG